MIESTMHNRTTIIRFQNRIYQKRKVVCFDFKNVRFLFRKVVAVMFVSYRLQAKIENMSRSSVQVQF
ncbi:MAG: hypothetical protein DWH94_05270 [Planctomycetota bacterium]|nr:MAG: hypothetical protein DWH94_05270 [Planctomycetota bacterium]